jgi:hypothetical protein
MRGGEGAVNDKGHGERDQQATTEACDDRTLLHAKLGRDNPLYCYFKVKDM